MTEFRMKSRILTIAAAFLCCISCIESNTKLGGTLIPIEQTYKVFTTDIPLEDINVAMADSLSGYSQTRISVGAIRDEDYGLTTRATALTLIPMFVDNLDLGTDRVFKRFHISLAKDTTNYCSESQKSILQKLNVFELDRALDPTEDYDCNGSISHGDRRISSGIPVFAGGDSLSFNFSREFGEKYLSMTSEDVSDMDKYLERFPGIYIESDKPSGNGGRINMFDIQLSYDPSYYYITGNYATLNFEANFNGERKDTAMYFYIGALDFYDLDSLLTKNSGGDFPQYALTVTGHETRDKAGKAGSVIPIEGGGGLKPRISATYLKHLAEEAIAKEGGIPSEAVINKASLVFPFEFPEDYKDMDRWPDYLSPSCRIRYEESVSFMGLTDASSSTENQGDINRSTLRYAPDITYHMQEILRIDEKDTQDLRTQRLLNGSFDIWLLIMANEIVVTENQANSEMSDYYNYLAYSSYYNNMYGGYGGYGYGGYGYGGYGNSYSNYYTYAMLAAMASSTSSTTETKVQMDKDRFYKASLNGPACTTGEAPRLELTFSIPNKAQ